MGVAASSRFSQCTPRVSLSNVSSGSSLAVPDGDRCSSRLFGGMNVADGDDDDLVVEDDDSGDNTGGDDDNDLAVEDDAADGVADPAGDDDDPSRGDVDLVVADPAGGAGAGGSGGGPDALLRLGPGTFISICNPVASNLKLIGLISFNTYLLKCFNILFTFASVIPFVVSSDSVENFILSTYSGCKMVFSMSFLRAISSAPVNPFFSK